MAYTYVPLQDIFQQIRQTHAAAAEHCSKVAAAVPGRSELLARYFQQRQQALITALESLGDQQETKTAETWVQYAPTEEMEEALASLCATEKTDVQEVAARALILQSAIVDLFDKLANNQVLPEIRELLLQMGRFEQAAAQELGMAQTMEGDA